LPADSFLGTRIVFLQEKRNGVPKNGAFFKTFLKILFLATIQRKVLLASEINTFGGPTVFHKGSFSLEYPQIDIK